MTELRGAGLSKNFGGVQALSDISLTLRTNEIHGLVGPNGCGKTTLLNLFCGYYPADGGTVTLSGLDISALVVEKRVEQGVARTFQTPRVLGKLSVLDNVVIGAWRHRSVGFLGSAFSTRASLAQERRDRALAMQFLEGVGLADAASREADSLEHGQRRFLEIARALMTQPRFLLMDEPAGGLTHVEIERLGSVIDVISKSGMGVLIVEHHTDFVFSLCHQVTALNLGRMLVNGPPDSVRLDPDLVRVYLGE